MGKVINTETTTQNKYAIYRGINPFINETEGMFLRMVPVLVTTDRYNELVEKYSGDFTEFSLWKRGTFYVGGEATIGTSENFESQIRCGLPDNPNILIMRDEGAGDLLLCQPTVHAIRLMYPDSEITFATKPCYFDIISGNRDIDEIISVHKVSLAHDESDYDLIINWCRAVEDYSIPRNTLHRIDSFAAHIGVDLYDRTISVSITEYCASEAKKLLGKKDENKINIAIVLSAASWARSWPEYNIPKLIEILRDRLDDKARFILLDKDVIAGEVVEELGGSGEDVVNLCGKTKSFMEAAAIIKHFADVVVAPDTGLAHVAGALKKKTVVIMGTIPAEVRYSTYKNVSVITARDCGVNVPCSPCWDFQKCTSGANRFCRDTKENHCLDSIRPEHVAERICDLVYYGTKLTREYSIIVPTHVNNIESCEQNKEWISGIAENSNKSEIIIVDNGSCVEFRAVLNALKGKYNLKVISTLEPLSYSKACNAGAELATTDKLCFLNSDVVIKGNNWQKPFIDRLNAGAGIVGASGRKFLPDWHGGAIHYDSDIHYVEGWCVWMTRETFNQLSGWDESFVPFYCEDADLSLRTVYSLHKTLEIVPPEHCKVVHLQSQTIKKVFAETERAILKINCDRLQAKWKGIFTPEAGFQGSKSVAILIPAHVKKEYLIECLESVKYISHRDCHVYVALDRMEFEERKNYPNFTFFDLDFGEVNHTRNYLIENSIEPFIYFLDADNYILPGAIEKFKFEILKHNADVCYSQAVILDQSDIKWFQNQTNGLLNTYPFSKRLLRERNYIDMGSMIRRSALPSGKPFDVTLAALHDWDLWLTMMANRKKFHYVEEPLFVYRVHENNLSKNGEKWNESITLLRKKHGLNTGHENEIQRISLVTIAKTQAEIDEKIRELSTQTIVPDEYCYSTHPDLATAWVEAFEQVTGDIVIVNETDAHPVDDKFIEQLLNEYNGNEIVKCLEVNSRWENYAGIVFSSDLIKKIPLKNDAGLANDTEWFCECKAAGINVRHINNATVLHDKPLASRKQAERAFEYGCAHASLINKYNYFPINKLRERHRLQIAMGSESLRGMNTVTVDSDGLNMCVNKLFEFGLGNALLLQDVKFLYRIASTLKLNSKILEIGTQLGRSTRVFSMAAPYSTIITVDKVNNWSGLQPENVIRINDLSTIAADKTHAQFDMIFIDGDHSAEGVLADYDCWIDSLKPGGVLAFHDYHPNHPGVMKVVDELNAMLKWEQIKPIDDEIGTAVFALKRPL